MEREIYGLSLDFSDLPLALVVVVCEGGTLKTVQVVGKVLEVVREHEVEADGLVGSVHFEDRTKTV